MRLFLKDILDKSEDAPEGIECKDYIQGENGFVSCRVHAHTDILNSEKDDAYEDHGEEHCIAYLENPVVHLD